jgi:hypothetical protein
MDGDVTPAIPVPVAASPDVARARGGFDFNDTFGRRLRRHDFDIFVVDRTSLMDDSFFYATGRHCDQRNKCHITQDHVASQDLSVAGVER